MWEIRHNAIISLFLFAVCLSLGKKIFQGSPYLDTFHAVVGLSKVKDLNPKIYKNYKIE